MESIKTILRLGCIDHFVMLLTHLIFWLTKRLRTMPDDKEAKVIERELSKIDMKDEFAKYSKLQRKLNQLKKSHKEKQTIPYSSVIRRIIDVFRYIVPCYYFKGIRVCSFPRYFFFPIKRIVSYPHYTGNDPEIVVGFCFFWGLLVSFNSSMFRAFFKE